MKHSNLLQLQWLDEKGRNQGGLYVDLDSIEAVFYHHSTKQTFIRLSSGKEFAVPWTVSELLDEIQEREQRSVS